MAKIWEEFEKSCVEYLNDNFGQYAHLAGKVKEIPQNPTLR